MILTSLAVWFGIPFLFWDKKGTRTPWILITAVGTLAILGPGRTPDPVVLRTYYVQDMQQYTGSRYIWGGESPRGIDCSGLIRVGMIDSDFKLGISTFNPRLIRAGISLWWHDCSAAALKNQYRNSTIPLFDASNLNALDYSRLLPGDFVVTNTGLHTLAYIGDRSWIEADPNALRVITLSAPNKSIWFGVPMTVLRWRQLETSH